VHIHIFGPKVLQWNFLEISAICTKWCAQTFSPIFGLLAIFDCNFVNIVAPSSDKNENCVVHLKRQSLLKKRWKQHQNRLYKLCHKPVQTIPLEWTALWTLSVTASYKHRIFAPIAGARCSIYSILSVVIEDVEAIKKVPIIFLSNA